MLRRIKKSNNPYGCIIFGGRKNYIRRCKGLISREEYLLNRLSNLCSLGESNQKGNRKFQINQDLHSIEFKNDRQHHYTLELKGIYGKREKVLSRLYDLQNKKEISLTYSLDREYIYISFDESKIEQYKRDRFVENRVMAIDMNPNYIGWSIVDWKSSSEFNVINSGVYSTKQFSDEYKNLNKLGNVSSDDLSRIYLNNKRSYETVKIA